MFRKSEDLRKYSNPVLVIFEAFLSLRVILKKKLEELGSGRTIANGKYFKILRGKQILEVPKLGSGRTKPICLRQKNG